MHVDFGRFFWEFQELDLHQPGAGEMQGEMRLPGGMRGK
jgi:hypothetical protein